MSKHTSRMSCSDTNVPSNAVTNLCYLAECEEASVHDTLQECVSSDTSRLNIFK